MTQVSFGIISPHTFRSGPGGGGFFTVAKL